MSWESDDKGAVSLGTEAARFAGDVFAPGSRANYYGPSLGRGQILNLHRIGGKHGYNWQSMPGQAVGVFQAVSGKVDSETFLHRGSDSLQISRGRGFVRVGEAPCSPCGFC